MCLHVVSLPCWVLLVFAFSCRNPFECHPSHVLLHVCSRFFWINHHVLAHHCELNKAWECEVILCLCSEYISGQGGLRISRCMFIKGKSQEVKCVFMARKIFSIYFIHLFVYTHCINLHIHQCKANSSYERKHMCIHTHTHTHTHAHAHTHCCILTVFLSWCLPLTT